MRPALWWQRRDENHLFGARGRDFLEHADQAARPIAQAMGLAAPRPFRGKPHQVRLGGHWHRERGRKRVNGMVAGRPAEVERFRCSGRRLSARPREEPRAMVLRQQRKDEIATRIHVVRNHQELTESRLAEIFGNELDVAAAQFNRGRRRQWRGATNQIPEFRAATLDERGCRERAADQPASQPVRSATLRAVRECRGDDARTGGNDGDERREHRQSRHVGRHSGGSEQRFDKAAVGGIGGRAGRVQTDEGQEHSSQRDCRCHGKDRDRQSQYRARGR